MVKLQPIDFDEVRLIALAALYHIYSVSGQYTEAASIGQVMGRHSPGALNDVLKELVASKLAAKETTYTRNGKPDAWKLTKKGAEYFGSLPESQRNYLGQLIFPLKGFAQDWELVSLDTNGPDFVAAVSATERALSAIEADNEFSVSAPDERDGIVRSLRDGLHALKTGAIAKGVLRISLVKPLRFVWEKFATATIGELAIEAARALTKLLF